MRDKTVLAGGAVEVNKNIDRAPEVFVVYSSKGGAYRWWEYPATKEGYSEALATAEAVARGQAFPPPVEEIIK